MKKIILSPVLSLLFLAGCASMPKSSHSSTDSQTTWRPENQARIAAFFKAHDRAKAGPKVAVFDWDNTMIKNDIGDATTYWLLNHDLIHTPKSWKLTSKWLSTEALKALSNDCHTNARFLPTKENTTCTDTIMAIYEDGKFKDGAPAWRKGYNPDFFAPSDAWVSSLLAGYTMAQARQITREAIAYETGNPIGATQHVGSRVETAYIRVYKPMKDLVTSLHRHGFEVWTSSGSPQSAIEAFSPYLGISPDHVLAIQSVLDRGGRITYGLKGCGPYHDGNQEIMTTRKGKRCWINKVALHVKGAKAMLNQRLRIALAAGDGNNDIFFNRDAHDLHIVINRHSDELMCNAYANRDGKWIVNPMFIDPMPQKKDGFKCESYGLPNQADRVF